MDTTLSDFANFLLDGYERWRSDKLEEGWKRKDASAAAFSKEYGWKNQSWSTWTTDQSLPDTRSLIAMVRCPYLGPEVLDKLNMFPDQYGERITKIQKKLFTASDQKLNLIEKLLTAGEGEDLQLERESS